MSSIQNILTRRYLPIKSIVFTVKFYEKWNFSFYHFDQNVFFCILFKSINLYIDNHAHVNKMSAFMFLQVFTKILRDVN